MKIKSDCGSGYSQISDSGSKNRKNPAGVKSGSVATSVADPLSERMMCLKTFQSEPVQGLENERFIVSHDTANKHTIKKPSCKKVTKFSCHCVT